MHLTNFFPHMSHCPAFGINFTSLRRTLFRDNCIDGICLQNPIQKALHFLMQLSPGDSTFASPSVHLRPALRSRSLQRSFLNLFPRFTVGPPRPALRSRSLQRSSSQLISIRPALRSRSLQRSSSQAISTLHRPSILVRRFDLAPSSGAPPKLFPRFTAGPPSFLPSLLHFLPSLPFLPSFLHFLPSPFPSFLPSFLPCSSGSSVSLPLRQSSHKENPSIGDAFGNYRTG